MSIATSKFEAVEWSAVNAGFLISVVCVRPLFRLGTRLWPPAAQLEGYARGHNLKKHFFPTCYGPEFVAQAVRDWIKAVGAKTAYIEPGSPRENGYCENFKARFCDEFLNGEIFYSLREAQILIQQWKKHYNTKRPHSALGYRPPAPETIVKMDPRPVMHEQSNWTTRAGRIKWPE